MRALAVLVALLVLGLAFAARTPATLVDARVAQLTGGKVRVADAEGTVWAGRGVVWGPGGAWQVPIAWRLDPVALLRGALRVRLVPDAMAQARGEVDASETDVVAREVHLTLPAAVATTAWKSAGAPLLTGDVTLDAPALHVDRREVQGSFHARWAPARVAYAGAILDLGTVEATGQPQGDALEIALHGEGGDVAVDGHARVEGNVAAVDATLVPAPTLPPALALLLRSLGPPTPNGGVRIVAQQPWR